MFLRHFQSGEDEDAEHSSSYRNGSQNGYEPNMRIVFESLLRERELKRLYYGVDQIIEVRSKHNQNDYKHVCKLCVELMRNDRNRNVVEHCASFKHLFLYMNQEYPVEFERLTEGFDTLEQIKHVKIFFEFLNKFPIKLPNGSSQANLPQIKIVNNVHRDVYEILESIQRDNNYNYKEELDWIDFNDLDNKNEQELESELDRICSEKVSMNSRGNSESRFLRQIRAGDDSDEERAAAIGDKRKSTDTNQSNRSKRPCIFDDLNQIKQEQMDVENNNESYSNYANNFIKSEPTVPEPGPETEPEEEQEQMKEAEQEQEQMKEAEQEQREEIAIEDDHLARELEAYNLLAEVHLPEIVRGEREYDQQIHEQVMHHSDVLFKHHKLGPNGWEFLVGKISEFEEKAKGYDEFDDDEDNNDENQRIPENTANNHTQEPVDDRNTVPLIAIKSEKIDYE